MFTFVFTTRKCKGKGKGEGEARAGEYDLPMCKRTAVSNEVRPTGVSLSVPIKPIDRIVRPCHGWAEQFSATSKSW